MDDHVINDKRNKSELNRLHFDIKTEVYKQLITAIKDCK